MNKWAVSRLLLLQTIYHKIERILIKLLGSCLYMSGIWIISVSMCSAMGNTTESRIKWDLKLSHWNISYVSHNQCYLWFIPICIGVFRRTYRYNQYVHLYPKPFHTNVLILPKLNKTWFPSVLAKPMRLSLKMFRFLRQLGWVTLDKALTSVALGLLFIKITLPIPLLKIQ